MISVQSDGCAPVVKAYQSGADHCDFWENAKTFAGGIRVPLSLADRLILDIIRKSGGTAVAVSDEDMLLAQQEFATKAGIFSSPEGAATLSALRKLLANGFIRPGESTVLFVTASGVKYL
jgi:threonine synthase